MSVPWKTRRTYRPFPFVDDKYHSFLDFMQDEMEGIGFIVPQRVYVPRSGKEATEPAPRTPPRVPAINFKADGRLGVSIREAVEHKRAQKVNLQPPSAQEAALLPVESLGSRIRIEWPGYESWDKFFAYVEFRTPEGMGQLARRVAALLLDFLNSPTERVKGQWQGWDDREKFKKNLDKVYLLRLVRVSNNSWQPVFSVADDFFADSE